MPEVCAITGAQYCGDGAGAVRFPVAEVKDPIAEKTTASQALELPFSYLNGVASHDGRWWFANSYDKYPYCWGGSGEPTRHEGWVS